MCHIFSPSSYSMLSGAPPRETRAAQPPGGEAAARGDRDPDEVRVVGAAVQRREAARALASGVTSGECKVLQVVQTLGPLLTTDSAHKRLQGMLVLADVLGMCSGALDVGEQ